ncbi:hypothetical protein [uncultured Ruminococcus sp.]|uniref:hypothetical protein n=1 Tax=uncultured Ruminococcus sp. TaxID=165186 RepID=UPI0026129B41|nr:hypothetical protein [uncultured Ruminococcus sp.]
MKHVFLGFWLQWVTQYSECASARLSGEIRSLVLAVRLGRKAVVGLDRVMYFSFCFFETGGGSFFMTALRFAVLGLAFCKGCFFFFFLLKKEKEEKRKKRSRFARVRIC